LLKKKRIKKMMMKCFVALGKNAEWNERDDGKIEKEKNCALLAKKE